MLKLLITFFVGGFIGVFTMAILNAASDDERYKND